MLDFMSPTAARARLLAAQVIVLLAGCASPQSPVSEAPEARVPTATSPLQAEKPAPRVEPMPVAVPQPSRAAQALPDALTIVSTELFEYKDATLSPAAKSKLDRDVVGRLREFSRIERVKISGHTDRIGSAQYNQRLSEERAESVKEYLVSKGVDGARIEVYGFGKTSPVHRCPAFDDREVLIACLAPNRRVVVEIRGQPR